jgi:hypothetical protein
MPRLEPPIISISYPLPRGLGTTKKKKKKEGEITLYPLKYPPICTFNFEVSSMTLNPPKLSNCGNSTPLAFLFPKCPHPKIKKQKTKKKMLRWPGGGSATLRPAVWGWPNHL